jgi:hypothetical protein
MGAQNAPIEIVKSEIYYLGPVRIKVSIHILDEAGLNVPPAPRLYPKQAKIVFCAGSQRLLYPALLYPIPME